MSAGILKEKDVFEELAARARRGEPEAQRIVAALAWFIRDAGMNGAVIRQMREEGGRYEAYVLYFERLQHISRNKRAFGETVTLLNGAMMATPVAAHLEASTQLQKYHNVRAGHGFAAEDANALNDFLAGKKVEKVGLDNKVDGPDRIVDGVAIQVKYYRTARESIKAAFGGEKGYRYPGQKLEVPHDQYQDALKEMRQRIGNGEVRDAAGRLITDVREAENIVQQGSVTYEQARNIARAGNIDSLVFDVKNQCVTCGCMFGVGFAVDFARSKWSGRPTDEAFKGALANALQTSLGATITGVLSSQLLRTHAVAHGTVLMRHGVKAVAKTQLGKSAIEQIARYSLGKSVYGAAAVNHVSKLLRTNVLTAAVGTAVTSLPDFYRAAIARNISWAQFTKNLVVNCAGVAGGAGGWFAGAAAGAAVGSAVPIIGTAIGGFVGGLIGACGGGMAASKVTKAIADQVCEDDARVMIRLVQAQAEAKALAYLLSEEECGSFSDHIKETVNPDWLKEMYASGPTDSARERFAGKDFEEYCDALIRRRPVIVLPSEEEMSASVARMVEEEWVASLHPLDPRLRLYRMRKWRDRWRGRLAAGLDREAALEIGLTIGAVLLALGCLLWLGGYFPKTALALVVLAGVGWYLASGK